MQYEIYTIRDVKADAYFRPFYVPNRAVAVRAVSNLVQDTQSDIGRNPEDYQLFYIGTYDDNSGVISAIAPEHILNINTLGDK